MAAPRKITEKAWREFWGRSRSPQLTPEQIKLLQKQGVFLRYQPVAEGQLGLKSIEAQVESASVGVSPTKAEQKELDALRIQVERLKTLATAERELAAHERRRYDELLERHDRLLKHLEQTQWQGHNQSAAIADLAELIRAPELLRQERFGSMLREFYRLTAIWKTATVHLSNITEKCSHPAYERIIAMGTDVLPYIFEELDREPDDWFVALRALTGVNPVPSQSRGNLKGTIAAWFEWAKDHGYFSSDNAKEGFPESQPEHIRSRP